MEEKKTSSNACKINMQKHEKHTAQFSLMFPKRADHNAKQDWKTRDQMSRDMTKPTKWQCAQRRLGSRVFAVRMKKAYVFSYPLSAKRRLWSDWVDAKAYLSIRWVHSHFVGSVMRRLKYGPLVDQIWAPRWQMTKWAIFQCWELTHSPFSMVKQAQGIYLTLMLDHNND